VEDYFLAKLRFANFPILGDVEIINSISIFGHPFN
jgi:hypothetical protein